MFLVKYPEYLAVREDYHSACPSLKKVPEQWKSSGLGFAFYKHPLLRFPAKDIILHCKSLEGVSLMDDRRSYRNIVLWNGHKYIISEFAKNLF